MTVICILGMHRSGTSCLAGSLQASGLFTGEVHEWNSDNLKGQRENLEIMDFNNSILKDNEGAWDNIPKSFNFTQEHQWRRDEIISDFDRQSSIWMFKDPRTVLMLNFWREGLKDLQLIGSFRHPISVAMSLYQRNQMAICDGIELWLEYNRCLIEAWRQSPFPLICFDLDREDYLSQIEETVIFLNTRLEGRLHLATSAAREFYESKLVHEKGTIATALKNRKEDSKIEDDRLLVTAEELYQELRQAAGLTAKSETSQNASYLIPIEETIEACQEIIELQPDNPKVYFMLGNIQREQGELDSAISSYQTALKLDPENLNIYQNLGNCFQELDLPQSAIELYQNAMLSQPNNPVLYGFLGKAQQKNGEIEAAIASYQSAINLVPKYALIYTQVGSLFNQQGQLDQAIEYYQKTLEIQPRSPNVYVQLGNVIRKQGNLDEAMVYYHQALEFDSKNFGAYKNMGDALKQQEKWDETLVAYQTARELQPENPWINLTLGNFFRQNERIEEAIACYQKTLELDDKNFGACKNLADLLCQQEKIEASIAFYQKALKIQPNRPGIHNILGRISWKNGNQTEAIEHYQQSIALNPQQSFSIYKRLGDLLRQQGQPQKALSAYQTALKIQPENSAIHNLIEKLIDQTPSQDSSSVI